MSLACMLEKTKFVSYKDIKKLMADLKLVYAAPTEESALNELELFKDKWHPRLLRKIYRSSNDKSHPVHWFSSKGMYLRP